MAGAAHRSIRQTDPPLRAARPQDDEDDAPPLSVPLKSPRPGLPLSALVHVGLAVFALFLLKDGRKFEMRRRRFPSR